jgi:hypothetical protein
MSREYILLSTLERETVFSAIYRPKRARNRLFFAIFGYFVWLWRYIWLLWISPPPPLGRALPPPIVGTPSSSRATRTVSSSFKCRPRASRLRPRHDVSPPSLLLAAWKSYMTSSHTTTSIYIAARIRKLQKWPEMFLPVRSLLANSFCSFKWQLLSSG